MAYGPGRPSSCKVTLRRNSSSITDRLIVSNEGLILEKLHSRDDTPLHGDLAHRKEGAEKFSVYSGSSKVGGGAKKSLFKDQ
jgi:hypothetical protein